MKVIVVPAPDDVGIPAASEIASALAVDPSPVWGVATGSTPLPLYRVLADSKQINPNNVTVFGLDEYIGLPAWHEQSYHTYLKRYLTVPLGLDSCRVHLPDGMATNPDQEAARYEQKILAAGGITVQVLGIGSNGHIGFNEPPTSLDSRTRVVQLAEQTRRDNARFFGCITAVPDQAITQGLGTIRNSRRLILIATGANKQEALARAIDGPVSESCPASAIQEHNDAVVIADEAAAAKLNDRYEIVSL